MSGNRDGCFNLFVRLVSLGPVGCNGVFVAGNLDTIRRPFGTVGTSGGRCVVDSCASSCEISGSRSMFVSNNESCVEYPLGDEIIGLGLGGSGFRLCSWE